jgi:hypothetical protein
MLATMLLPQVPAAAVGWVCTLVMLIYRMHAVGHSLAHNATPDALAT